MADEVRVRLEVVEGGSSGRVEPEDVRLLDRLYFQKPIRRHIVEFAWVFAIIAWAVAAYVAYESLKNGEVAISTYYLAGAGAVLVGLGHFAPLALYPFWKGWMMLANVLNMIMTPVILCIMWVLVFIPTSMLLKCIGKRIMDLRYDPALETYWEDRDDRYNDWKLLERQF